MNNSMEQRAMMYSDYGYNCAESVLKAAEDVHGLVKDEEMTNMCSILANGMGVGCFCGAILVGMMVLGRMFDPVTAKRLRIQLLWEFSERFSDFNCHALKRNGEDGCMATLRHVCRLVDALVAAERGA